MVYLYIYNLYHFTFSLNSDDWEYLQFVEVASFTDCGLTLSLYSVCNKETSYWLWLCWQLVFRHAKLATSCFQFHFLIKTCLKTVIDWHREMFCAFSKRPFFCHLSIYAVYSLYPSYWNFSLQNIIWNIIYSVSFINLNCFPKESGRIRRRLGRNVGI